LKNLVSFFVSYFFDRNEADVDVDVDADDALEELETGSGDDLDELW